MSGQMTQVAWPKPGKVLIGLIGANVVVYVLQLLLLRANQNWVIDLYLSPAGVFDRGYVWQPLTYMFLHNPGEPWHLLLNMVWLWMFGSQLEKWWGTQRFVSAYFIFGLGGAALTLLMGVLSTTSVFAPLLPNFYVSRHLGASGVTMGMVASWGLVYADQEMNFLLLGRMKGKTFVLIILAFELLRALSFSGVSSTSHFGGMAAAYVLCRGLWRPAKAKELLRRVRLHKHRKKLEGQLRVLEGGKKAKPDPKDPKNWN